MSATTSPTRCSSAGVRYNDDIRAGTVYRAFFGGLGSPFFGHANPLLQVRTNYAGKKHFHNTSPHLQRHYKITDDVSAYATYSEGYKSGGFDMRGDAFLTPATSNGYGPENIRSYEVGVKGSFFDQRLSLNLAAFLEPYKNVQVTIQTPATPPAVGIASVVANAASAQIEGFELEGHAAVWGPLSANFSIGLADANFVHTPFWHRAASSISTWCRNGPTTSSSTMRSQRPCSTAAWMSTARCRIAARPTCTMRQFRCSIRPATACSTPT